MNRRMGVLSASPFEVYEKFRQVGDDMNLPATTSGKSHSIPCLRCILSLVLPPSSRRFFFPTLSLSLEGKTIAALAGIRDAWVRDLHDKQLDRS